jgi:hypothetical protein
MCHHRRPDSRIADTYVSKTPRREGKGLCLTDAAHLSLCPACRSRWLPLCDSPNELHRNQRGWICGGGVIDLPLLMRWTIRVAWLRPSESSSRDIKLSSGISGAEITFEGVSSAAATFRIVDCLKALA